MLFILVVAEINILYKVGYATILHSDTCYLVSRRDYVDQAVLGIDLIPHFFRTVISIVKVLKLKNDRIYKGFTLVFCYYLLNRKEMKLKT